MARTLALAGSPLPIGKHPGSRRALSPRGVTVVAGTSPTVRQRELGTRLRELRNDRGMTVEEVAEKLLCSATKISRLETGARRPSLRDVRDLCQLYDVEQPASADLMVLARQAREQGWWAQYEDLKLDPYIGLEQEATSITSYTMFYFPALLQTEEYAGAVIKAMAPRIDPAIHQQRVEARLRRQQLLVPESRPRYRVLLDEAVLHHRLGDPAVMIGQLEKILKLIHDSKAMAQIIPFDYGVRAGQDSNFVLLEFEGDSNLPPVVFVESLTGMQFLERRTDIIRYREAVDYLRDSALSSRDSAARISDAIKMYTKEQSSAS
jgi:transcriptional regulator with XRE-family HTH domain